MKFLANLFWAIAQSRQLQAEEILRRHAHLVHQAREYELRRNAEEMHPYAMSSEAWSHVETARRAA